MKTALSFSGGKDSLACLYLNHDRWDSPNFFVVWVNSGDAYPETIEFMAEWRGRVRNFIEVRSNQPENISRYGYPSDILPGKYSWVGRTAGMRPPYLIQSYFTCCAENIWIPMKKALAELGVTEVIRGQRRDDRRRAPIEDAHIEDGITYRFPLAYWSAEDVMKYLRDVGAKIPEYYAKGEMSSRDCVTCTAYLNENEARIMNLPADKKKIVAERLRKIEIAIKDESRHVNLLQHLHASTKYSSNGQADIRS